MDPFATFGDAAERDWMFDDLVVVFEFARRQEGKGRVDFDTAARELAKYRERVNADVLFVIFVVLQSRDDQLLGFLE